MRLLYLVQSLDSGRFLVPDDGYVGWTRSLRHALSCGLVDLEMAQSLIQDHGDCAEAVFVRTDDEENF